jgi:hypothetical protein
MDRVLRSLLTNNPDILTEQLDEEQLIQPPLSPDSIQDVPVMNNTPTQPQLLDAIPAAEEPIPTEAELDAMQAPGTGVVESGRLMEDQLNAIRGQEGIEPDKPKSILDQLDEYKKSSDQELKTAQTFDALGEFLNMVSPLVENRQRARAMRNAQSIAADPGKLNLPVAPTDSAKRVLSERQQKIKELMDQMKMGAGTGRVFQTRQGLVRLDEEGNPVEIYKDPVVQEQLEAMKGRLGLSGDRLDLQKQKEENLKEYRNWRKAEADEPSDKQVQDITAIDSTLDDIERLEGMENLFTGPIQGRIEAFKAGIGASEKDKTVLLAQVRALLSKYGKQISGAAIAEPEFKRLEAQLPKPSDPPEVFIALLDRFKQEAEDLRLRSIDNIERGGKNPGRLADRVSAKELRQEKIRRDKFNQFYEKNKNKFASKEEADRFLIEKGF